MIANMRTFVKNAALTAVMTLGLAGAGSSWAVDPFVLPTPENNANATYELYPDATGALREAIIMNGIPIAFLYDEFWSYSAKILESIQTVSPLLIPTAEFGTYNFSVGTGVIDVNLTSVAGGATNVVTLSDGTVITMQDPDDLFSNQQVTGWVCDWGGSTQTCDFYGNTAAENKSYSVPASGVNGTTTVGEILTYLQDIDPSWTIPLIYADYNQTGAGDSLWMSAMIQIINPDGNIVVADWFLDTDNNMMQDPTSATYNFGDITFEGSIGACTPLWDPVTGAGCAGVTDDGSVYSGSHNLGSGKADFMAFAPTMDLSLFDPSFLWVTTIYVGCIPEITGPFPGTENVGCQTNGGEEFGIIGGVGPGRQVPIPGTLALIGIGLAGFGFAQRRRASRRHS